MSMPLFANFAVLSMEFSVTNCLQFFFQTDGNFYQMILSHTLNRVLNKSLMKNVNVIRGLFFMNYVRASYMY